MTFGSVKNKNKKTVFTCHQKKLDFNKLDNSLDYLDIAVFLRSVRYSLYVLGLREQILEWFTFQLNPNN